MNDYTIETRQNTLYMLMDICANGHNGHTAVP